MFSFPPLSETECLNLLKPGEYEFMVKNAEQTISKTSGRPMMKLTIAVYDNNGIERTISDYLMDSFMFKVRSFAYGVGLDKQYEAGGFLPEDCVNRSGKCEIIVDEPEPGSKYGPKNVIKKYVKSTEIDQKTKDVIDPKFNDALPF